MARPLNRAQALQNQEFLRELRRAGNIRLAARAVGLKYSTMQYRRRAHPAFAIRWNAALVFAQARLNKKGLQGPTAAKPHSSDGPGAPPAGLVPSRDQHRFPRAAHRFAPRAASPSSPAETTANFRCAPLKAPRSSLAVQTTRKAPSRKFPMLSRWKARPLANDAAPREAGAKAVEAR